jgi:hypothetical protein
MPHATTGFATRALRALTLLVAIVVAAGAPDAHATRKTPNILFVIMDDVGIDQMRSFGYGGATPPSTPTIDKLASNGVRFHNTWAMPACSTSRSLFFTGRYPLRTNVYNAIGTEDLANSMVSPYEMTTPKLLAERNYKSALFGKFHLGVQGHNPFRYAMPKALGWDYFYGWLDETGDPSSIDKSAGGVGNKTDPPTSYSCGFVPGTQAGGADWGACYAADGTCKAMAAAKEGEPPGRTCRDGGGIFDPFTFCRTAPPSYVSFETLSGHYVSPLVINPEHGAPIKVQPTDIRARTYRGIVPVDAAIDWIGKQPKSRPWMATVSFASAHTPVQQPPTALLPSDAVATNDIDCDNTKQQRILTNQMIEALDHELARLLVGVGIATRASDGSLAYDPAQSDTMIVLVGDNGTLGYTVKEPFDSSRAKGTAYQTGVWVPLVVAGPIVRAPDREVLHMVNIADLYELFGEIAGIDVHKAVPRTIDSVSMLPYLVDPKHDSIRKYNFTQVGPNLQANGGLNGPCVLAGSCSQIPPTQSVCEDNGGTWWGMGATANITQNPPIPPEGLKYCCSVNKWIAVNNIPDGPYSIQPLSSLAIRDDHFKIVQNFSYLNDSTTDDCYSDSATEFYPINQAVPLPTLDKSGDDLLATGQPPLNAVQQASYDALSARLTRLLASEPECTGDGNIDGKVNGLDLADWRKFERLSLGESSWYDIIRDGLTDEQDLEEILKNLGTRCGE